MAVFHGKAGTVTWDGGAAMTHVLSFELTITADVAEATAMGDTWKTRTVGFKDASATVSAYLPVAGLEPAIADLGASGECVLETTTGKQYHFAGICTDISMSADANGNPTVNYSFVNNDASGVTEAV